MQESGEFRQVTLTSNVLSMYREDTCLVSLSFPEDVARETNVGTHSSLPSNHVGLD